MPPNPVSILSPDTWPFDLAWLPLSSYVVGGAVRDALIARPLTHLDLDFIIPTEAVKVARQIAHHYQAGFVLLDPERQIARVVFPDCTLDFAQLEGDSLGADLGRRDFTINAIAYDPRRDQLIDPLKGQEDLKRKQLRMVSPANLADDPLRLLRAYRQAAQLGFEIEAQTHETIRHLAHLLPRVAVERVQTELSYLLSHSQGMTWLRQAWEDGLLQDWFPQADQNFEWLLTVEAVAEVLSERWPVLAELLSQPFRESLKIPLLAMGKLVGLLSSDLRKAEAELMTMKYSNAEIKAALIILKYLPEMDVGQCEMSTRKQYFLFRDVGNLWPVLAVVAVARGVPEDVITPLMERYLDPSDLIAHPQPVINGHDLIQNFNLAKGPQIGELLTEIAIGRGEGKINTVAEALEFARNLLNVQEEKIHKDLGLQ